MFSKNKPTPKPASAPAAPAAPSAPTVNTNTMADNSSVARSNVAPAPAAATAAPKPKNVAPSVLSSDLFVKGDIETSGDIQVEGRIKGNIRAHLLTVGEGAIVEGEVRADDATIHGTIKGTLRGLKIRLSSSARVEGDIIHKTIAIESGAHFQGSVMRQDDPTEDSKKVAAKPAGKPDSNDK